MSAAERREHSWLEWEPAARTKPDSTKHEPTKPSKPGFVGSVASISVAAASIEGANSRNQYRRITKSSIDSQVDSASQEERVMSWCEWKAAALNRLFLEQGVTGQPGRISPDTIRQAEQKQANDE